MSDEMKAAIFAISWETIFILSIINARFDIFAWVTVIYVCIVIASAKLEKAEKRLKRYKDDADKRGREEMEQVGQDKPRIVMTKGKSA